MVLDIAEGVRFLKSRGFEQVVLLGQSGGGSLMAFYQAQAVTTPPGRVSSTPAGDPPNLNEFDLPPGRRTSAGHSTSGRRKDPGIAD